MNVSVVWSNNVNIKYFLFKSYQFKYKSGNIMNTLPYFKWIDLIEETTKRTI